MTSVIIGQILASLGHFWVIKSESAFALKPSRRQSSSRQITSQMLKMLTIQKIAKKA
jgi:hypothetical protein